MKKVCLLFTFLISCMIPIAQSVTVKLNGAVNKLEQDPQMEAGMLSLYIMDAENGQLIFEKNSRYGMAIASTQKLFTAAAAMETLGQKFTYSTVINLYESSGDAKSGWIEVIGSGDPSLGSWRFSATKNDILLKQWAKAIRDARPGLSVKAIRVHDFSAGYLSMIPDGYIWQDIGNYYGAGTCLLNWNENQYDIHFKSGSSGTKATVVKLDSVFPATDFRFSVKAGVVGSGDNTYIYAAPFSTNAVVSGTIPPNKSLFTISGSTPDPGYTFGHRLRSQLNSYAVPDSAIAVYSSRDAAPERYNVQNAGLITSFTHVSPSMDTLVFWFLRKSINLYGDAFVKTFAREKGNGYNLERGLEQLIQFWKGKGIGPSAMSLLDGSGLSPQNRVTTKALAQVLKYSAGRDWFPAFLHALPTFNGMKMKSGSINGARAFAGYHTATGGKKYIFAIVVNNYTGSSADIVKKMYAVLDILK